MELRECDLIEVNCKQIIVEFTLQPDKCTQLMTSAQVGTLLGQKYVDT